jgi:hypothetical protein
MTEKPLSNSEQKPGEGRRPWITALVMGALAAALWRAMGPDNAPVALMVTFCTINLGLAAIPLAKRFPARWYHVPRAERWVHRLLAVPAFGWLLERSGWNRTVALPMRHLKVTRASLRDLLIEIHGSEGAHAIAFVPHAVLAALLLATGQRTGAPWILLPGIAVHLYPALLQRWMTLRVAPLMRRSGSSHIST